MDLIYCVPDIYVSAPLNCKFKDVIVWMQGGCYILLFPYLTGTICDKSAVQCMVQVET